MNASAPTSPRPKHLWVVGVVSLLWNAVGAFDYLMTQTRNASYMSQFSEEQLEFFYGFPMWVEGAWAIAVWGALAGSVMLLFTKRLSVGLFLVSLVAMVLTTIHNYFLSNGLEVNGDPFSIVFTVVIALISIALFLYARAMAAKGVLN
jgi:hypothetical protein